MIIVSLQCITEYWGTVASSLPMVEVLDGRNREGAHVGQSDVLADIPGNEFH